MKNLHPLSKLLLVLTFPVIAATYTACTSKTKRVAIDTTDTVSVMAYNVENLFDTKHDENKEDYTYLPLSKKANPLIQKKCRELATPFWRKDCLESDWNDEILEIKMKRIADTLLQVDGKGPDIAILVEVENKDVLEELNDSHLNEANYKTTELIEGEDERGIDVAVLSRFPLARKSILHKVPLVLDGKPLLTRGILQVPLKMPDNRVLNIFAVHFPSQHSPTEMRLNAAQFLNKLVAELPADELAIAGGDFNVTAQEEAKSQIYSNTLASIWQISHLIGCKECEGTHNFRGKWSYFDLLLFNKQFSVDQGTNYSIISAAIETPTQGLFQVDEDGIPLRFNAKEAKGVSDHLPILGRFKLKTGN